MKICQRCNGQKDLDQFQFNELTMLKYKVCRDCTKKQSNRQRAKSRLSPEELLMLISRLGLASNTDH